MRAVVSIIGVAVIGAGIGPAARMPVDRRRKALAASLLRIPAGIAPGVALSAIDAPAR